MTPENGKPEGAQKAPRHRSPNYPGISLKTAVEKITTWYKADGLVASPKDAAMKHMGGDVGRVISALKSFGVINEADGRIKLAQRGIDIVARPQEDPKRKQALKDASLSPVIYNELVKQYAGGLPSDTTLQSELIAGRKFNPKFANSFIEDFKATLEFAGITPSAVVDLTGEGEHVDVEVKIGDYVQWESQGTLRLPEPRRVRAFAEDPQWVYLDGSETAVPKQELIVTDPAIPEKPAPAETPVVPSAVDLLKRKSGDLPKQVFVQVPKMRSYTWALSGDFSAKLELYGEAQTDEDLDALIEYVEITVKALKRSLKKALSEKIN
jgi:hypothetical protein